MMRHMEITKQLVHTDTRTTHTIVYYVTVNELVQPETGAVLEYYGIGVTICESGESAIISNVTFSKTDILSLVSLLSTCLVTPVSVRDVVDDWLFLQTV